MEVLGSEPGLLYTSPVPQLTRELPAGHGGRGIGWWVAHCGLSQSPWEWGLSTPSGVQVRPQLQPAVREPAERHPLCQHQAQDRPFIPFLQVPLGCLDPCPASCPGSRRALLQVPLTREGTAISTGSLCDCSPPPGGSDALCTQAPLGLGLLWAVSTQWRAKVCPRNQGAPPTSGEPASPLRPSSPSASTVWWLCLSPRL